MYVSKLKKIILAALLLAATIVLNRFLSIKTPIIVISFSFIPVMLCGILLGPWWTALVAGLADLIGALLFPFGAYFFGYTLSAIIMGFIYGLFLNIKIQKNNKKFLIMLILSTLIVIVFCNAFLNSLWVYMTTKNAIMAILPTRLVKQLIMLPIQVVTIYCLHLGFCKLGVYARLYGSQDFVDNLAIKGVKKHRKYKKMLKKRKIYGICNKFFSSDKKVKQEIQLENVCLKYPKFEIKDLSLKIDGGIVAITGNNASGKTTLIKIIAGLVKVKKGRVLIGGKEKHSARIGIVLQNPDNQIIFNNVYDDIAFTLKNYGLKPEMFESRIRWALRLVEMEKYIHSETFSLSTGQKQRIAIANMLAIKPDIMIFDEASVYLDPSTKQVLYKIFGKLKKLGVTVIFTTNLIEEICYADRVIILTDGKIVADKTRAALLKNLDVYRKLGVAIPLKLALLEKYGIDYTDEQTLLYKTSGGEKCGR